MNINSHNQQILYRRTWSNQQRAISMKSNVPVISVKNIISGDIRINDLSIIIHAGQNIDLSNHQLMKSRDLKRLVAAGYLMITQLIKGDLTYNMQSGDNQMSMEQILQIAKQMAEEMAKPMAEQMAKANEELTKKDK